MERVRFDCLQKRNFRLKKISSQNYIFSLFSAQILYFQILTQNQGKIAKLLIKVILSIFSTLLIMGFSYVDKG